MGPSTLKHCSYTNPAPVLIEVEGQAVGDAAEWPKVLYVAQAHNKLSFV